MKACRKHIATLLVVGLIFIFSTGVLAENDSGLSEAEQAMTEATAMVVYVPVAISDTKYLLARSERAVAGLLNRYYFYGYLNH